MKAKALLTLTLTCFIFAACSNNAKQNLEKEKNPPSPLPALEEKTELPAESKKERKEITLSLDNGKIMTFQLDDLPLLKRYLESATNPELEIERMKLITISNKENVNYYLIAYSCGNKNCSYLLFNPEKGKSLLVADVAILQESKFSSDSTKLLLHFKRPETKEVTRDNIVIINLNSFELIPFITRPNEQSTLHYTYPILSSKWKGEDSIEIEIPMIKEATFEELYKWTTGKKITTLVTLNLKE